MEVVYATLGTLSGVSILLLALGLSLGLRPWPPVPWLRPWLASYWVTAFTLLGLSLPLVVPSVPIAPLNLQTFAFLNSGFFLATGLQAVGWARLRWGSGPLLGALLPMAVYLGLFLGTGVQHNPTARMILFSSFQAALQGILALWAHQGLRRQAPHLMIPCAGVLALHGLYHLGRVASSLLGPGEMDYILSVAVTVVEGLLYTIVMAYLQWLALSEHDPREA